MKCYLDKMNSQAVAIQNQINAYERTLDGCFRPFANDKENELTKAQHKALGKQIELLAETYKRMSEKIENAKKEEIVRSVSEKITNP